MNNLRRKLVLALTAGMMMIFVGCSSNKQEEQDMTNFKFTVQSKQEFDYIKYKVGNFEGEIKPMHSDTKVNEGYSSNVDLDQVEMDMEVEVIQDGKVILDKKDIKIDLTDGKKATVNLVDKDNGVDIEIKY